MYSFTAEENGDYLISAEDENGNVASQTVTVSKIDKIQPVIGGVQLSDPDVVEGEKTLTFTVTDEGESGLGEVTVNNIPVSSANGVYSYLITANGSYIIRAADNAGNEAEPEEITVFQIGIPELALISQTPDNDTFTSQDVIIQFSVKNLGRETLAVSPSGTITAVDEAKGIYQCTVSANGEYTVTAGSEATPLKVTVSNIDQEPPICTMVQEQGDWRVEQQLSFTVSDPAGFEEPEVKDPYGESVEVTASGSDRYTFTAKFNGDYTITVRDSLGNEDAKTYSVTRIRARVYAIKNDYHSSLTIGESSYYASSIYGIQNTAEKSSEIAFLYSLSCSTETIEENPALTSEELKTRVYISMEDACKQGKLEAEEIVGLPGYKIQLTPGHQYYLVVKPINRQTGEEFHDNYGTISWSYTITVVS